MLTPTSPGGRKGWMLLWSWWEKATRKVSYLWIQMCCNGLDEQVHLRLTLATYSYLIMHLYAEIYNQPLLKASSMNVYGTWMPSECPVNAFFLNPLIKYLSLNHNMCSYIIRMCGQMDILPCSVMICTVVCINVSPVAHAVTLRGNANEMFQGFLVVILWILLLSELVALLQEALIARPHVL